MKLIIPLVHSSLLSFGKADFFFFPLLFSLVSSRKNKKKRHQKCPRKPLRRVHGDARLGLLVHAHRLLNKPLP